jgi:hypothetical protein
VLTSRLLSQPKSEPLRFYEAELPNEPDSLPNWGHGDPNLDNRGDFIWFYAMMRLESEITIRGMKNE